MRCSTSASADSSPASAPPPRRAPRSRDPRLRRPAIILASRPQPRREAGELGLTISATVSPAPAPAACRRRSAADDARCRARAGGPPRAARSPSRRLRSARCARARDPHSSSASRAAPSRSRSRAATSASRATRMASLSLSNRCAKSSCSHRRSSSRSRRYRLALAACRLRAARCRSSSKTRSSTRRQVLLRRFELQLGLPATRLELGDARRLLDQLAPIGRLRAEDLTDLALLDDGVALDADPHVHQQVLHVAQPADVAVDQILALPRPIEPAADLDVAGNRLVDERRIRRRRGGPRR